MARSMVNQKTLIQREATAGTAAVSAMKQLTGVSMRPAYTVENEQFRSQGFKLPTTVQISSESGTWSVDGIQDYNHLGYPLSSRIAVPVTTTPAAAPATTPLSRQHVFTLDADGADAFYSYTAQFGDNVQAIQATYGVFQSLTLGIARGGLDFGSGFISREPATGATLATTGVTTVTSVPIAARSYDIFSDSTWAGLGATKLLAAYEGNISLGDKYAMDMPINSAVTSYESVVEAEDQEYSGSLRVGFDAVATALVTTYKAGAQKYIRILATGPLIETTVNYKFQLDFCVTILSPGEIGAAPNSPVVTLPFDFIITPDPVTGNAIVATLVNTIASYA